MIRTFGNNLLVFIKKWIRKIDWRCVAAVLIAFGVTRLMVLVITYFSMAQLSVPSAEKFWRYNPRNLIADGLLRWDTGWYLGIARFGYDLKSTAFFPLYPLLIRLASLVTGNIWTSGLWISNGAFLIALFYFYALARQEFDSETAGRAVFYLAAAPAAFFFSTVYSESIFVLFVVACFYYARNGKWIPAALAGALASATRLPGILVTVFIFFEALWQQDIRFIPKPWRLRAQAALLLMDLKQLPKARKGILACLFSTSGLIAYMVFLYQKFGTPFAFLHAETDWNRKINLDWFIQLVQNIIAMHKPSGNILSGQVGSIYYLMDTFALVILIPLVVIVFLKFRPSFGWYTFLALLMPLVSSNPVSMRRFALGLIPCTLLLAVWGKRPWVDRLILGISLPLQAYLLVLFSHWLFAG
ncbi:predicted integral membrane protein [Longilinea arvoryzae]|uniref:Predicted integral membrane protein n=1 Tax=Longilinea arvoryzae TaxID=360412 RepID=A0A0S7BER5_9CHLR|nr:mannosyltransferase family protein [Longilinea arvoryzae]GAP12498.1 predicted integral membrane protein [Longilinea arvoryzae]